MTEDIDRVVADTKLLDVDKVEGLIGHILAYDPACGGRVTMSSITRIASLVMQAEKHALTVRARLIEQSANGRVGS